MTIDCKLSGLVKFTGTYDSWCSHDLQKYHPALVADSLSVKQVDLYTCTLILSISIKYFYYFITHAH